MQQKRGSHASTVAFDHIFALGGWDANAFLVGYFASMPFQHILLVMQQPFMLAQRETCVSCLCVNAVTLHSVKNSKYPETQ